MKKQWKKLIMFACILVMGLACRTSASAATTVKGYLICKANTKVYSNSRLTTRSGLVFPSDEITIRAITPTYCKISYPVGRTRRKTGYIRTSALLTTTRGYAYTAKGKIQTYRRPYGTSYGYISAGDRVIILGTVGDYTQVRYPVSSGYKYAFVSSADAALWIKAKSNIAKEKTSTLASPVPAGAKFSKKTWDGNGRWYHDINRGVYQGMPVYAVAADRSLSDCVHEQVAGELTFTMQRFL